MSYHTGHPSVMMTPIMPQHISPMLPPNHLKDEQVEVIHKTAEFCATSDEHLLILQNRQGRVPAWSFLFQDWDLEGYGYLMSRISALRSGRTTADLNYELSLLRPLSSNVRMDFEATVTNAVQAPLPDVTPSETVIEGKLRQSYKNGALPNWILKTVFQAQSLEELNTRMQNSGGALQPTVDLSILDASLPAPLYTPIRARRTLMLIGVWEVIISMFDEPYALTRMLTAISEFIVLLGYLLSQNYTVLTNPYDRNESQLQLRNLNISIDLALAFGYFEIIHARTLLAIQQLGHMSGIPNQAVGDSSSESLEQQPQGPKEIKSQAEGESMSDQTKLLEVVVRTLAGLSKFMRVGEKGGDFGSSMLLPIKSGVARLVQKTLSFIDTDELAAVDIPMISERLLQQVTYAKQQAMSAAYLQYPPNLSPLTALHVFPRISALPLFFMPSREDIPLLDSSRSAQMAHAIGAESIGKSRRKIESFTPGKLSSIINELGKSRNRSEPLSVPWSAEEIIEATRIKSSKTDASVSAPEAVASALERFHRDLLRLNLRHAAVAAKTGLPFTGPQDIVKFTSRRKPFAEKGLSDGTTEK